MTVQTGISQVAPASVLHLVCSIRLIVSGQYGEDKPFRTSKIGLVSAQLALAHITVICIIIGLRTQRIYSQWLKQNLISDGCMSHQ